MEYTLLDIRFICKALKEVDPKKIWNAECVRSIKDRIKEYKIRIQNYSCCYCRRDITGEFKLVLDIDHILPKSIYTNCIFDLDNLAVSCKKCNMLSKGFDVDFLNTALLTEYDKYHKHLYFQSKHYKFIHPNLDEYHMHISVGVVQINNFKIRKYIYHTEKGKYTFEYFNLGDFEVEANNCVQGVAAPESEDIYNAVINILRI